MKTLTAAALAAMVITATGCLSAGGVAKHSSRLIDAKDALSFRAVTDGDGAPNGGMMVMQPGRFFSRDYMQAWRAAPWQMTGRTAGDVLTGAALGYGAYLATERSGNGPSQQAPNPQPITSRDATTVMVSGNGNTVVIEQGTIQGLMESE